MIRGLLFEADELELRLALTLSGDQTRLNHVRATANLRSQYLNTVRDGTTGTWQIADGFHLQIFADRHYTGTEFHASAAVQFRVWINTTDFTHTESVAYTADSEYECRLRLVNYRVVNDAALGLGLRIDQIIFESDGWDLRSSSGVWVDPVTQTLMLTPLPLTPEWQTTSTGAYARIRRSDTDANIMRWIA